MNAVIQLTRNFINFKRGMKMSTDTNGATVKPDWQKEQIVNTDTCKPVNGAEGQNYQHKDVWVWEGGVVTNKVRCSTCGRVVTKGE